MLAINTSSSESTGYSPAFLTQGRNPRLPKALYDEVTIGSGARCLEPNERANELKEIFKVVKRNLEKAYQRQRYHYNLRRRNWAPKIGDLVLVRQHPLSKAVDNFVAKLAPKFKGPYITTGFISPVIVEIKEVETSEKRTAHISELKTYHSNTPSCSLLFPRSPKSMEKRGENMDAERQKFERSRERFRRNMKQEKEKRRRTILLTHADTPSTSKSRAHRGTTQAKRQPDTNHTRPNSAPKKSSTARNFRMTVITPPGCKRNEAETIEISDEEEVAPPPPPLVTPTAKWYEMMKEPLGDGRVRGETPPPPPSWNDECLTADDLIIGPDDLEDPLVQEFWRTFLGASDDTVATRPPTPPSPFPPSSPSSIDWENENYRPPTPPRPRRYGTFEVQDRQYPYLGLQCYERVWRARILVPRNRTLYALPEPAQTSTPQWMGNYGKEMHGSPQPQYESKDPQIPTTPGKGWLHLPSSPEKTHTPSQSDSRYQSPTPSPPLLLPPSLSPDQPALTIMPTPPKLVAAENPTPDQLPLEIQQSIDEMRKEKKGKRFRLMQQIWGHWYRITVKTNGAILITLAEKRN